MPNGGFTMKWTDTREIAIALGEAHPDTGGNPVTPVMMPEEKALKANGGEFVDPSKLPDCASEIIGASFIASVRTFNVAF